MEQRVSEREQPYQEKEARLDGLFMQLPQELQNLWRSKIEEQELEIDDALRMMERVVAERTHVKERIYTKIHHIESKELQEEVRTVVRAIEGTFGNMDHFLGEGKMGEVYEMPYAKHICVKYLKNRNMKVLHGNDFREEVSYMSEMRRFSVSGIHVPEIYFDHSSDSITCFGMEKIKGLSLNKIIKNQNDFEGIHAILAQPMKDVIARMRAFVEMMHARKKLVHRDLEPRNIMVDNDGNWYVIDFGKAKRIEIGDDSTNLAEAEDLVKVEHSIRQLYESLKNFDKESKT